MVDVVDKATRSRMMSGIRAKNTKPEVVIRKGLHAIGFRYRLHAKDIPGKPDIVLPKYRALVIVQGCFWHGHGCRYFKLPESNTDFWRTKISENCARDTRDRDAQHKIGWRTLVVWECAVREGMRAKPAIDIIALIASWLSSGSVRATIDETGFQED